jgi:signal peptidase II
LRFITNRYGIIACVAGLVAVLDQLTKYLAMQAIPLWTSKPVIDGFFNLVHVRNRGAAFGFLNNGDTDWQFWFFAGVTVLAAGALFWMAKTAPPRSKLFFFSLGLILGGAAGNFIDRCRFRYVIDFLDFYLKNWHWPAFNVADIGITVGVLLLIFFTLRGRART